MRIIITFTLLLITSMASADYKWQVGAMYELDKNLNDEEAAGFTVSYRQLAPKSTSGSGLTYTSAKHKEGETEIEVETLSLDFISNNTEKGKLDLFFIGGIGTLQGDKDGEFLHFGLGKVGRIGWEVRALFPQGDEDDTIYQAFITVGF